MNLFKHLESGRRFPPRRILLYGMHGIGTSSFAAGLPSPVFVPADASTAHIDCPRFPVAGRFDDLMQALQDLYIEPHDYRTVILDPLGAIQWLIRDQVCRERDVKQLADLPHAGRYTITYWRRLLRRLEFLRTDIDLHIALVGHARLCPTRNQSSPQRSKHEPAVVQQDQHPQCFEPALSRGVSALLQCWCDEVLFATVTAPSSTTAASLSSAAAAPAAATVSDNPPEDRRVIYTRPSHLHVAKNHLDLPVQLPLRPGALTPYLRGSPEPLRLPPVGLN